MRARINQSRLCRSLEYSRMLEFVLIVLMILLGKLLFNFIEFLFLVSKFNCTNMPFHIFPVMRKCSIFFMLLIPWTCFSAYILVLDCYVNILWTVAVPLSPSRTSTGALGKKRRFNLQVSLFLSLSTGSILQQIMNHISTNLKTYS